MRGKGSLLACANKVITKEQLIFVPHVEKHLVCIAPLYKSKGELSMASHKNSVDNSTQISAPEPISANLQKQHLRLLAPFLSEGIGE